MHQELEEVCAAMGPCAATAGPGTAGKWLAEEVLVEQSPRAVSVTTRTNLPPGAHLGTAPLLPRR